MPQTSKRSRRQASDRSATTDLVTQIECAAKNPQATLIGALIGGVVPWFARALAHHEVPAAWSVGNHGLAAAMLVVVMGCALFSALTVYKFGKAAFGDSKKALGFTMALEGVMLVASGATSTAALVVLIAINALANGSVIAMARAATCKQRESRAKAAATRARRTAAAADHGERAKVPVAVPSAAAPSRAHALSPSRRQGRQSQALARKPAVQWMPAMAANVIDAEIVGEHLS